MANSKSKQELESLLTDAVVEQIKREWGPSVSIEREARIMDKRIDILVRSDSEVMLVECRTSRKNIEYFIGQMSTYREKFLQQNWESMTREMSPVQLALALPENQISYAVEQKIRDAGIRLISVDIEIEQPAELNIYVKLVEGPDDDLLSWYRDIPDNKRQTRIKEVLRDHLKNRSVHEEIVAMRSDISELSRRIEALQVTTLAERRK